jgi:hypothetical protein
MSSSIFVLFSFGSFLEWAEAVPGFGFGLEGRGDVPAGYCQAGHEGIAHVVFHGIIEIKKFINIVLAYSL